VDRIDYFIEINDQTESRVIEKLIKLNL